MGEWRANDLQAAINSTKMALQVRNLTPCLQHPPDRVMIGTKRVESGRLRISEPASTYFGRHTSGQGGCGHCCVN
jgi:hypothetical protein